MKSFILFHCPLDGKQFRTSLGSWFGEYDPAKPVMLFVSGLVPYTLTFPVISKCSEAFNCFVMEPLQEHYDYIFDGEPINEVAALYNAYFDAHAMDNVKVSIFMGYCFSGEIAANMALQYAESKNVKPALVFLDTKFRYDSDSVSDEEIERLLPDQDKMWCKRGNRIGEALTRDRVIPSYDGRTLQFLATVAEPMVEGQVVDGAVYAERNEDCRRLLRQHFSNLHVVEMEAGHVSMLEQFSDVCFPYITNLITSADDTLSFPLSERN